VNNANKIRCLVLATLWFLVLSVPALALDTNQPESGFLRTHFTTDDGLPGGVVNKIAQTKNGFLWLITNGANLSRFDGKSFYQFEVRPSTLAVAPDGDLWVGTKTGLIRIPSSNFNQFTLSGLTSFHPGPGKADRIVHLCFSKSGVLWVGTNDGLFRYEGGQFVALGPRVNIFQIEAAPDGHILAITEDGFIEFSDSEIVPHPQLADQLGVRNNEIRHVLRDSHGTTWYCTALGVARETNGRIEKLGTYAPPKHAGVRTYEDAQGTIWIAKDEGLFRATSIGLESVADGMQVRGLFSDRDGNLWVGTNGDGLHRFKNRAIRMYTTDDGLPNNLIMTVIVAHDGVVWTGANCGGVSRFDGTKFQTFSEKDGLLNSCVWALVEDASHDLWIGTFGGGAFRYHNGTFTQYSKSQGMADDRVSSIVAARDGSIWFATPSGLSRLKDGQLRNYTKADGLSIDTAYGVFEDRAGVIWAGTPLGLDRLVGDRFENLASVPKAVCMPFGEDRDGGFFVESEAPEVTLRLSKSGVETIRELSLSYDMLETEEGEFWFGGVVINRVPPGRFAESRRHDEPLDCESFSTADGLATAQVSGAGERTLALSPDGKLWAATPKGLAMFDLRRLPITTTKPSVYLTDVTIGRDTQHAGREIVLPPGTNHVEIDFAAVEISSPEKIRMQYRLDGVDSEWLDAAAANPQAIYSNIPVGTHSLHIRACNRNGIWDRQGTVFSITQQPYFYETTWFRLAMVATALLLVVGLYRLRLRQTTARLKVRFDERLAERTRIARELHDTLLQTVQGSKLVADNALEKPNDAGHLHQAMTQLSGWLGQATQEGRAALNSLRTSTMETDDLAEGLRRATEECVIDRSMTVKFSVTGGGRDMHPIARDEIYRIGYEAIRNACEHSSASELEIHLNYADDLTLQVNDNGSGIEPSIVADGKAGHFGLQGMRERAERIGSDFTFVSSPNAGTAITLVVPGKVIYRKASTTRLDKINTFLGRKDRPLD
jgi:signal transduction histidine kinase/ligand-binding sensor domain-containing protein